MGNNHKTRAAMKKQHVNRKYNFPDADLYVQAMERISHAVRDLKHFQEYGYDKDRLQKFTVLCKKFEQLPNDDELVGDQMVLTDKKMAAAEKLKSAIRSIMTRVAMKYNNRSGRYRKFGTAKMGDMTDAQLLFCGRRVSRVALQQIDFLEETGINDSTVQKVRDAADAFERALNIQQDKIADRDIAVENRTTQGNKIYDEMIVLSNIGKDIWVEKDPVKYEQYCVYESNNDQKIARKEKEEKENKKKKTMKRGAKASK